MIRLLLVDDHAAFRETVSIAFSEESDIAVTAEADSVAEILRDSTDADVAIVNIDLQRPEDVQALKEFHTRRPQCAVLVLTDCASDQALALAVEAGAAGVLSKTTAADAGVTAIRCLSLGGVSIGEAGRA